MDIITTQNELRLLTGRLIKWGGKYKEARKAFGDAKCELDILLTPKQDKPYYQSKNACSTVVTHSYSLLTTRYGYNHNYGVSIRYLPNLIRLILPDANNGNQ